MITPPVIAIVQCHPETGSMLAFRLYESNDDERWPDETYDEPTYEEIKKAYDLIVEAAERKLGARDPSFESCHSDALEEIRFHRPEAYDIRVMLLKYAPSFDSAINDILAIPRGISLL